MGSSSPSTAAARRYGTLLPRLRRGTEVPVRSPIADGDGGPDGRCLPASTFAAKIAAAGNLNGSKNRSSYAGSKILDALIPATPAASPVSSTQHIYLTLDNPSYLEARPCLPPIQADLFESDSGCRPLHTGYQLPFQHAAVEARFDPNSKLHRNLPPRLDILGETSLREYDP